MQTAEAQAQRRKRRYSRPKAQVQQPKRRCGGRKRPTESTEAAAQSADAVTAGDDELTGCGTISGAVTSLSGRRHLQHPFCSRRKLCLDISGASFFSGEMSSSTGQTTPTPEILCPSKRGWHGYLPMPTPVSSSMFPAIAQKTVQTSSSTAETALQPALQPHFPCRRFI